ncbi:N-acetylmuramoyl-L-alanine amidase [Methylomonas sp. MO1]|uniref:N-acetylmuramoyl-L-alanine amidase n=1 Tax=Methylomonas sp. MO1 TaxID=3073619 RepID=UPI0028A56E13|nr:N-acetylmuramoyl-L-alanine amidase [Methylomonas sp. MO1]MDT4291742.1 N-acetylmuramoyl-L-alanine amidase [Methylomonas sp. MO1]
MVQIESARIQSDSYGARTQKVDTLVLHYTALDLESSLRVLRYRGVSAHYVLAPDGVAYKILNNDEVAWHAGVSMWRGKKLVNGRTIGVEIVNLDGNKNDYPQAQVAALVELCRVIISENPSITNANVVGHSDVAPKRKVDPGKNFPWKLLADQGVGLWPKLSSTTQIGTDSQIQALLEQCGYAKPHGYGKKGEAYVMVDDPAFPPPGVTDVVTVGTKDILKAFQLHYQPSSATGTPNLTTMRLLEGLAAAQ